MPVTGVRYNSVLWMCTLNTLTWPDQQMDSQTFRKNKMQGVLRKDSRYYFFIWSKGSFIVIFPCPMIYYLQDTRSPYQRMHPLKVVAPATRNSWCSSVVRSFAHGAMGCRIDPSWWTHWDISLSSQCSATGITKVVVCVILSVRWSI